MAQNPIMVMGMVPVDTYDGFVSKDRLEAIADGRVVNYTDALRERCPCPSVGREIHQDISLPPHVVQMEAKLIGKPRKDAVMNNGVVAHKRKSDAPDEYAIVPAGTVQQITIPAYKRMRCERVLSDDPSRVRTLRGILSAVATWFPRELTVMIADYAALSPLRWDPSNCSPDVVIEDEGRTLRVKTTSGFARIWTGIPAPNFYLWDDQKQAVEELNRWCGDPVKPAFVWAQTTNSLADSARVWHLIVPHASSQLPVFVGTRAGLSRLPDLTQNHHFEYDSQTRTLARTSDYFQGHVSMESGMWSHYIVGLLMIKGQTITILDDPPLDSHSV